MTRLKILGATAILASALTAPAMAQQVIYNPGYCAQFYPNANCQNKGPGSPYTDPNFTRGPGQRAGVWSSGETVTVAPRLTGSHRASRRR